MIQIITLLGLGLLGAALGSFAVAQVWRIRAAQLKFDKDAGEKIDKAEWKKLKQLVGVKKSHDRSHCLHCGHILKWYDLIPIFSWLNLKGKCRKCEKPIGKLEIATELILAGLFILSFLVWPFADLTSLNIEPLQIASFVMWLAILVILTILFIYDAKWSLLSFGLMVLFIILASAFWVLNTLPVVGITSRVLANLSISMLILPGVYLLLNLISKGAWVGSGDWIISIGLILLLPNIPVLAMMVLFLSNFIGSIFIITASTLSGKGVKRGVKVPFAPFLIFATLIVFFTYSHIINFLGFVL